MAGAALALLSLASLPANGVAAQWLPSAPLSPSGHAAESADVAMDPGGDAVSLWEVLDAEIVPGAEKVETADRPGGALAWQPHSLLQSFTGEKEIVAAPHVAIDARGDAVAAWQSFNGAEFAIEATTRSGPTGTWSAPAVLEKLGAMQTEGPDVAVNAAGAAVIAWAREEKFIRSVSSTAGSAFGTPEELSNTGQAQHTVQVALDAAGNATAVWEDGNPGETQIFTSTRPAGGKWGASQALSAKPANANEPRVAVDARGDAVAVWERPESGGQELLEAATRPAGKATWSGPQALTKTDMSRGEPAGQQVAIDASGNAVVVWSRTNSHNQDLVEASERNIAGSTWNGPVVISGLGRNVEEAPQVAINPAGEAIVVFERFNGANEVIEATTGLASSQSWGAPVALSAAGGNAELPQVSLDERGDATAVWQRSDGKNPIAEAATYDLGPQLGSISIPSSATVGQTLAFSVGVLSPIWPAASTTWNFGDGATATGAAVSHAYSTAGTFHVTATTTDTLGVSTGAVGTVTVPSAALPSVAPKISGARLSNSRFRVAKGATAISAARKAPLGTSFRFTLSEAARLQIKLTRSAHGLRSGRRCLAPSAKLKRKHAKSCRRTVTVGTLTRAHENAGADTVAFSGRIGRKPLPPGVYRATLTATANGLASLPVGLSLTVTR